LFLALLLGSILRSTQREVTFLRVLPGSVGPNEFRRAKRDLTHLADDYVRDQCQVEVVQNDDALATIAQHADQSDLVVLGVQRLGRRKKLFSSFTRRLAQRTTCPIVVLSRRG